MTLKIYGPSFSISPRRVADVCKETKIELISSTSPRASRGPWAPSFTTHQPCGQMQYIERSPAKTSPLEASRWRRWIHLVRIAQATPNLIPTELKTKAIFEQAGAPRPQDSLQHQLMTRARGPIQCDRRTHVEPAKEAQAAHLNPTLRVGAVPPGALA
ncbi:hypothetical protein BV22DRAFT_1135488 [Leucogyrophana mollusca]|uniref:Uncharacterized protein n=1 Tax=Leucogyrophana mollusca TaxID=85980 RepID=A0ACB8AWK4_9AGAM|nr:hypothetical protein BV22DRAFT_1135488 [Leucogyrophana mollusca]